MSRVCNPFGSRDLCRLRCAICSLTRSQSEVFFFLKLPGLISSRHDLDPQSPPSDSFGDSLNETTARQFVYQTIQSKRFEFCRTHNLHPKTLSVLKIRANARSPVVVCSVGWPILSRSSLIAGTECVSKWKNISQSKMSVCIG